MMPIPEDVLSFAIKQGYDGAVYLKKWKGYLAYEPIFGNSEVAFVGLPLVILKKGNEIRMSTAQECMQI